MSVAFSPNDDILISGSMDGSVRLWDIKTGECLATMEGGLGKIYSVQFAPNGKYIVAGGAGGCLQFWDIDKQKVFLYRYCFGSGAWLDLLPDGRFEASPNGVLFLSFREKGTHNSYMAEELRKEFNEPNAIRNILRKYFD